MLYLILIQYQDISYIKCELHDQYDGEGIKGLIPLHRVVQIENISTQEVLYEKRKLKPVTYERQLE